MKKTGAMLMFLFLVLFTAFTAVAMLGSHYEFEFKSFYSIEVLEKLETKVTTCEAFDDKLVFFGENEMLIMDEEGNLEEIPLSFSVTAITKYQDKYYFIIEDDNLLRVAPSVSKLSEFEVCELGNFDGVLEFFIQRGETLYVAANGASSPIFCMTTDGENWTSKSLNVLNVVINCGIVKGEEIILGGMNRDTQKNCGVLITVDELLNYTASDLPDFLSVTTLANIEDRLFIGSSDGVVGYIDNSEFKLSKLSDTVNKRIYEIISYREKVFLLVTPYANHQTDSAYSTIYMSQDGGASFIKKYKEDVRFYVGEIFKDKLYFAGEYGEIYTLYSEKAGGLFG